MSFIPLTLPILEESLKVDNLELPPDYQEQHPLLIGLVLDISLQHHTDSKRFLDIIKEELVKVIMSLDETEDQVYVYHPDDLAVSSQQSAAIVKIMDYVSPPLFPEVEAINTTLVVIGTENHHFRKKFIYITDRNSGNNEYSMKVVLEQNKIRDYRCQLVFIGIGNKYNPKLLKLCNSYHLDSPYGLSKKISEILC